MSVTTKVFETLDVEKFDQHFLFKKPFALPEAAPNFRKLIGWPLIFEIIQSKHQNCWLAKAGKLHPLHDDQRRSLDIDSATSGFDQGYSVVIRHSEQAHSALKTIAEEFESKYLKPVDIQLYCTPAGEQGFDWHYDIEDVFVFQSVGVKEFRLRKNKNPKPKSFSKFARDKNLEQEMEGPEIRCTLKAGDLLYIPSGYWHCANALTPSFHLSVGVAFRPA